MVLRTCREIGYMDVMYEYQAIDGSAKGPVPLALLLQSRNHGRLSNQAPVRRLPDGEWRPLSSFIPLMTVVDDDGSIVETAEGQSASVHWDRKKYWTRLFWAWCSFRGRAGKQEMRNICENLHVVWFCLVGVPLLQELLFSDFDPYLEVLNILLLYVLLPVALLPLVATMVRRLHDVGRSGFWLVLLAAPVLGWLMLWYLCYGESQMGDNKYGEPPWN